jgi:GTP cyclohydrolase I
MTARKAALTAALKTARKGKPFRPSRAEALASVRTMLAYIGEDPDREGLLGTPDRVVRSWDQLYGGYRARPAELLAADFAGDGYDQMVILRDIEYWSMCEHHLLPFHGRVSVGYLPGQGGRVLGVSKIARAVEAFARRAQIQERMTNEIADALERAIAPLGVAVVVRGRHLCMEARGVEKQDAEMVTSAMRGRFRDTPTARQEFLALVGEVPR